MPIEAAGMGYADVLRGFADGSMGQVDAKKRAMCQQILDFTEKHPLLGRRLKQRIANKYEDATGQDADSSTWKDILQWFLDNIGKLPALIELIMSLLGVLGL